MLRRFMYTPANLAFDDLLSLHPPSFAYRREDFHYILGTIVRLMQRHDKAGIVKGNDFVSVNAAIMKRSINDYSRYLTYLREHKIIDCDDHFIVQEKSKGYKICDEYLQQGLVAIELHARKYTRGQRQDAPYRRMLAKEYGHLTRWFNDKLSIDADGALRYLEGMYDRDVESLVIRPAMRRCNLREISIERLVRKDFAYSVDNTSRRFHSNLTNLKSELRRFISYEGQPLCSVDVKNSQPFISTILFDPPFYEAKKGQFNLFTLSPSIYKTLLPILPTILSIISSVSSITMLVKSDETQCGSDLELYFTLVDKGHLYPYISNTYTDPSGRKLNVDIASDKRKLKEALFVTLYSDNRFLNHPDAVMKRMFKRLFPTVYKIFSLIKRPGKEFLPVIMQLVESEIILRQATVSIANTKPELPIFTVHDSVVTIESHRQFAYDTIKASFINSMGLKPSLDFQPWIPKPES